MPLEDSQCRAYSAADNTLKRVCVVTSLNMISVTVSRVSLQKTQVYCILASFVPPQCVVSAQKQLKNFLCSSDSCT